jgi:hypothetical protein
MSTHDFVYQTFIIYIFLKASVLLPLAWVAFVYSRASKRAELSNAPANDDLVDTKAEAA